MWAYPNNVPSVAKNWSASEQKKCIKAANAVLREKGINKESEKEAIFACINAAGKSTKKEDDSMNDRFYIVDGKVVTLKQLVKAWLDKKDVDPNVGGGVDRDKLKASDFVFGDERKFPVVTPEDVKDAVSSWGRYKGEKTFEEFKKKLKSLCQRKGQKFVDALPTKWEDKKKDVKKDISLNDYSRIVRDAWYEFKGYGDKSSLVEPSFDAWIKDVYDSYIIVEEGGELFAYPYTYDGKDFSFSMGIKVEVTYVPVGKKHVDKKDDEMFEVPIVKADEEKHLVYGAVLIPDTRDSQGDIITAEEIEKTAHAYLIQSRTIDHRHAEALPLEKARPVESYILPQNTTLGKKELPVGTWIMTVHIPDDVLWKSVKSGELNAFSIYGVGKRKRVD